MHAFLEWPCACRETVIIRIGREATDDTKPYEVSVTCIVHAGVAHAVGFNRPAGGFTVPMGLAAGRALRRNDPPIKPAGWERLLENGEKREFALN